MVNWIKTVPEGLLPDDAGGWLNRICRRLMKRIPQFPHRAWPNLVIAFASSRDSSARHFSSIFSHSGEQYS
ncbi:MAG: hypothetical protein ABWY64_20395 [Tardiphaga sp.]